jgi:hypothetical protein
MDVRPEQTRAAFLRRAGVVIVYGAAMAYLEAAVVVYLQRALAIDPTMLFPVRDPGELGGYAVIEAGREIATILMLGAVGWLAGASALERLAWMSVAFGVWDIGYYLGLQAFLGWPGSLATTDLLFLVPVPWVAPVWAPVAVSVALSGFGLATARRLGSGGSLRVRAVEVGALVGGGLVVIVSFTLDAGRILEGGLPGPYAWPVFALGMAMAAAGVLSALGGGRPAPAGR